MPVTQSNGRTGNRGDLTTKQWSAMLVKSVMDGCSSCTMHTDASAIVMDYATGIDSRTVGRTSHDLPTEAQPLYMS